MARTISEIKKQMTDSFIGDPEIIARYELTVGNSFEQEFSAVSIESILFGIVAFCIWTLEKLFDIHLTAVKDYIAAMKPHSKRWYETMSLRYQHGYGLPQDEINYDNTGLTDEDILASKVVAYASCADRPGGIVLKTARNVGGELQPLSTEQHDGYKSYIHLVKDAGVKIWYINAEADWLKLVINVYYDPLVLNAQGKLITDGTTEPARDAIYAFLKEQPFNGLFVPTFLVDRLQAAKGVGVPSLELCQSKYAAFDYENVPALGVRPYAGYLKIPSGNLTINYYPMEV